MLDLDVGEQSERWHEIPAKVTPCQNTTRKKNRELIRSSAALRTIRYPDKLRPSLQELGHDDPAACEAIGLLLLGRMFTVILLIRGIKNIVLLVCHEGFGRILGPFVVLGTVLEVIVISRRGLGLGLLMNTSHR